MALPALQSGVVHSLSDEEILYIFVGKSSKLQGVIYKLIKTKKKRDRELDFIQLLLINKDLWHIRVYILVNDVGDVVNTNDCEGKTDNDTWPQSEFSHWSFFWKLLQQTVKEKRLCRLETLS